jgi:single-strand DNA-binding protein
MEINKFNKLNISGRVGQDPEVQYFESGKCKAKFSVAVRRDKETTDWFAVEAWDKQAETIANYVKKGTSLSVTGYVTQETWDDKQTGEPRSKIVVKLDGFSFTGSKQEAEG